MVSVGPAGGGGGTADTADTARKAARPGEEGETVFLEPQREAAAAAEKVEVALV